MKQKPTIKINAKTHTRISLQQQQPFKGRLSGTSRVGRYQKKHSPAHTHPGQHTAVSLHWQRNDIPHLFWQLPEVYVKTAMSMVQTPGNYYNYTRLMASFSDR